MRWLVMWAMGMVACAPATEATAPNAGARTEPIAALPAPASTSKPVVAPAPSAPPREPEPAEALLVYIFGGPITQAWRTTVTTFSIASRPGQFAWDGTSFAPASATRRA